MLPEGWKRVPLHKIADIRTGLAKGKQGLKDALELPYLRVANVQDGHIDLKEVKTIQVGRADIDRYSLRAGDVLMTEGGDFDKLGRGAVWGGEIAPCLHQNHVFAVRPNADYLDSSFLSALSGSEYGRNYFLSCAKRSTNLASINSSQLKTFPVLLPRLDEQKGMSELLATWDAAIVTTEKLLANSRRQKQALIDTLLANPNIHRDGGGVWTQSTLGEIARIVVSNVDKKEEAGEENIQLCNYTDVYYNDSINRRLSYMQATATKREIEKFALRIGDVLITKDSESANDIAVSARVTEDVPNLICGYHLAVVRPNEFVIDPVFLQSYFKLVRTKAYFGARSNGVTRFGIPIGAIENAPIKFPHIDEQKKIAAIVVAAENEIEKLTLNLQYLKAEKRALMQQLLTGKRRVRLPATEAVSA